jgi:hypothetical protein
MTILASSAPAVGFELQKFASLFQYSNLPAR